MNTLNEVKEIFARSYYEEVNEQTTVNYDLEIMGDDADFFMQKFFERFNVAHENFDFTTYFNEEMGILRLYYRIFQPQRLKRKKPLTLGHLAAVAERGVWFDSS